MNQFGRLVRQLLSAILAVGLVTCAPEPDSFSYEEIIVDIEIDGARGTFSNLTRCRFNDYETVDSPVRGRMHQTGGVVAGELPNGKAFAVFFVGVCNFPYLPVQIHPWKDEPDWPGGYPKPIDPRTKPVGASVAPTDSRWHLYVFDDAENPTHGQYYMGPDAFWTFPRPVQVHSITTRHAKTKEQIPAWQARWQEQVTNGTWLSRHGERHPDTVFASVAAAVWEESVWSQGDENYVAMIKQALDEASGKPFGTLKRRSVGVSGGSGYRYFARVVAGVVEIDDSPSANFTTAIEPSSRNDGGCVPWWRTELTSNVRVAVLNGISTGLPFGDGPPLNDGKPTIRDTFAFVATQSRRYYEPLLGPCLDPARIYSEERAKGGQ